MKAWYDRYASAGFVVIGVHTPELSFERDLGNVRDAIAKADVRFPVAFDPGFATWNAFRNQYWPAFDFVDRTGRIRHVHFGEGDCDGSEQAIRQFLAESEQKADRPRRSRSAAAARTGRQLAWDRDGR